MVGAVVHGLPAVSGLSVPSRIDPLLSAQLKYTFAAIALGFLASLDFLQNYGFQGLYPVGYLLAGLSVSRRLRHPRYELMDICSPEPLRSYCRSNWGLISASVMVLLVIRIFTGTFPILPECSSGLFVIVSSGLANLQRRGACDRRPSFGERL